MNVLRLRDVQQQAVSDLLARFGLRFERVADDTTIEGSYWGEDEAGLVDDRLLARSDTPLHSILHEACHWIVMDPRKRPGMHTDASDSELEENATCYLQIVLADHLPGFGRERALRDMDAWGYSFRLGSAAAWFASDAADAREFLLAHQLLDEQGLVSFVVRRQV